MTQNRPPLWVNTDLASYLREQDGKDVISMPAPKAEAPLQPFQEVEIQDRRSAARKFLSGFAVIHTVDPDGSKGRYRVAQLRDISTTGIGLRLNAADPESFKEGREFEILFQFADQGKPLHMACKACRKALDEAGMIVGAVFKNPLGSLVEVGC